MGRWRADLRDSLRGLRSRRASSLAITAVLALGVGGGATVFGLADPFLGRPLPYPAGSDVLVIERQLNRAAASEAVSTIPTFGQLQERTDLFSLVGATGDWRQFRVQLAGRTGVLQAIEVTDGFLPVLGFPALDSTTWLPGRGSEEIAVALLAGGVWIDVDGHTVRTWEGESLRVVSTLPRDFVFPSPNADPAVAVHGLVPFRPTDRQRTTVFARSQPGVSTATAQAAIDAMYDPAGRYRLIVSSLDAYLTGHLRPVATGTVVVVLLMLAIAAANVGTLVLTRAVEERPEILTRQALGARRTDLWRLTAFRYATLASLGVTIGVGLSAAMLKVADLIMPLEYRPFGPPELTWRVTTFACLAGASITAVSVGIGLLGGAPRKPAIREAARRQSGVRRTAVRRGLLVVQGTMTMILLTGAALLVRSYLGLVAQDPILSDDVVVVSVRPLSGRSTRLQAMEATGRVSDRLKGLPGVTRVATGIGSLVDQTLAVTAVDIAGESRSISVKFVSAGYLSTLGIPLASGLDFGGGDAESVIVSESLAAALWPGGPAVGRVFTAAGRGRFSGVVVGVAGDVRDYALDVEPRRTVYRSLKSQDVFFASPFHFVLRLEPGRPAPEALIRQEVERGIPGAAVEDVSTVARRLRDSIADRTFVTFVGTVFAVVAIVVCLLGLAAVVTCSVAQRSRELAIRSALGATMADCGRLVASEAVGLTFAGVMAGVVGGSWLSRGLERFLYEVEPTDPLVLGSAALGLVSLALMIAGVSLRGLARLQPARLLARPSNAHGDRLD